MNKPTTIPLAVAEQLTGDNPATVRRWAARGYLGQLETPAGYVRGRLVEVAAIEAMIGREITEDDIARAVARHEVAKGQGRARRRHTLRREDDDQHHSDC